MAFQLITSAALGTAILLAPQVTHARTVFDFNDGTPQGWEVSAFDTAGNVFFGPTPAGFNDSVNYDGSPYSITDPADDNGAAFAFSSNFVRPDGEFSVLEFRSPDLSGDPDWQNLESVTGFVGQSFFSDFDYSAGVLVTVNDTTGGGSTERTFTTRATPMDDFSWNERSISSLDTVFTGAGIEDYETRQVAFRIFWDNGIDSELTFALDNVSATSATPPPNVVPLPGSLTLLGLGLGAFGVAARRRS